MSGTILLKGGTLLIHDSNDHVVPTQKDLLIKDDIIAKIEADIPESDAQRIIDCKNDIISPGFIDTHRHLWQTPIKGIHANHTLAQYMPTGNFTSMFFSAKDMFWGQLSGCLESLDVGTTTVVDHSHLLYSPEHVHEALHAAISSGLRVVYGYCPILRATSFNPISFDMNLLPSWVMDTFDTIAAQGPFANGRVTMGFAFDGLFLPKEVLGPLFERVRANGVKTITTHGIGGPMTNDDSGAASPNALEKLESLGLMGRDILVSHSNYPTKEDVAILKKYGAHISSTPSTELQMGHGALAAMLPELYNQGSLGVDCHSAANPSIPGQMNLALQHARAVRTAALEKSGKWPASVTTTVEEVYNLGTVLGARAVGLSEDIGSLKVGMKADIVVFEGRSLAMVAVAEEDPVAAIVIHSTPADIRTVICDGQIRKDAGKLLDTKIEKTIFGEDRATWGWSEIASQVTYVRKVIRGKMDGLDFGQAQNAIIDLFHWSKERMIA